MSDRWLIRIKAWPHSTGRGQEIDQAQAGEPESTFVVKANDMKEALKCGELIVMGMRTNPIVWLAPITEIRQAREDDYSSEKPEFKLAR